MLRLHELSQTQVYEWRRARLEDGRSKYGDAHMQRYGLVDAAEKLQDLRNILHLTADRVRNQWSPESEVEQEELFSELAAIDDDIYVLWDRLRRIDRMLSDHLCTDEQGGERVWWSEQVRREESV